jgi:hypothetical protein
MQFDLDRAVALLSRTPLTLESLLGGLHPEWVLTNEGENTWSPFDVVGHLIHGERTDWIPRIKTVLQAGESQAFEPFDRFAQFEESEGKSLDELLATFRDLRSRSIQTLEGLKIGPDDLAKTGKHPEFGRVTLKELIATWVVHDLDHLAQISRTMARQYREEVGPWRAYLSVLKWRED